ncbi:MAG: T9SS type A sorting domain-containing protein [Bacteroidetes bacterium]|nr:T9SS type A sorting domain-containing protein [Bacteroidota bacterium]
MKQILFLSGFLLVSFCLHAQWTQIYHTPRTQQARVMSSPNDQVCWFISNMDSLFKTEDGGQNWHKVIQSGASFNPSGLFVVDKDAAFKTVYGYAFKTTDGGLHWHQVFSGNTSDPPTIFMKDDQEGILVNGGIVYKTSNGGEIWNSYVYLQPPNPPINSLGKGNLQIIGDTIFIAASNSGVEYSADFGFTWVVPSNNGLSISAPGKISFANSRYGLAFYGSMPFIYRTLDGGNTWTTCDNSLGENEDVLAIGTASWYIPNSADHFYVKYSDDHGTHWNVQLNDPDGFDVLERSRSGHTLWAGSDKGKIYTMSLDLPTSTEQSLVKPDVSISPNPSTDSFVLNAESYTCPFKLTIVDLAGNVVKRENVLPGLITFGSDLKPGTYLVSVTSNNYRVYSLKVIKN